VLIRPLLLQVSVKFELPSLTRYGDQKTVRKHRRKAPGHWLSLRTHLFFPRTGIRFHLFGGSAVCSIWTERPAGWLIGVGASTGISRMLFWGSVQRKRMGRELEVGRRLLVSPTMNEDERQCLGGIRFAHYWFWLLFSVVSEWVVIWGFFDDLLLSDVFLCDVNRVPRILMGTKLGCF
jgi:hypothetical protein